MTQSALPAPLQFGKYWLDAELAVGGMARLYRARLRGPGGFEKKLVVKQILPQLAGDPSFIELLVREANTLVQMTHPNIVPIYELGVVDGIYFLAMELVEGATVAELLADGPLPPELAVHIAAQVCEALRYAHERFALVHRDVTPRNVIVDEGGHVKLLDFGIAAPLSLTGGGERFGSPGYMSPEQAQGESLSARSDLFSLGVVLHETLTGSLPAAGAGAAGNSALLAAAGELGTLVETLIAARPEQRPASAAEVAAQLRAWLAKTHPQGVSAALGRRAEHARSRGAAARSGVPITGSSPSSISGGGVTRSLATSHTLSELLAGGTERLPSTPERRSRGAQPVRRGRGATVLGWLGLGLASAAALGGVWLTRPAREGATPGRLAAGKVEELQPAAMPNAVATERPLSVGVVEPSLPPVATVVATAEPEAEKPRSPAAAARAYLTINALPWGEVRFDDRPLGSTPQRGVAVPVGQHALVVTCPPLGRSARIPLELAAGIRYQVLVDLQQSPPRVSIR